MDKNKFDFEDEKRMLTVKKAAEFLSVHPDTIRRWANNGDLASIRHPINRYRMFFIGDLMEIKWKIESLDTR